MKYSEKISGFEPKENAVIMGIETSCDETAVSLVRGGREVLADCIISSAPRHGE